MHSRYRVVASNFTDEVGLANGSSLQSSHNTKQISHRRRVTRSDPTALGLSEAKVTRHSRGSRKTSIMSSSSTSYRLMVPSSGSFWPSKLKLGCQLGDCSNDLT